MRRKMEVGIVPPRACGKRFKRRCSGAKTQNYRQLVACPIHLPMARKQLVDAMQKIIKGVTRACWKLNASIHLCRGSPPWFTYMAVDVCDRYQLV
jgi:hypothetical protein